MSVQSWPCLLHTARLGVIWTLFSTAQPRALQAQVAPLQPSLGAPSPQEEPQDEAPTRVEVGTQAADEAIAERLDGILGATTWFEDESVRSQDGVVFLRGVAETEKRKAWATELTRNTADVVAVVNEMRVREVPPPTAVRYAAMSRPRLSAQAKHNCAVMPGN